MMKYGVVLFPSKKLQDIANSYRKRYDPNYALIPPHLTLRTPFELTDLEAAEVVSTLREYAKNASPITLRIKKIQFIRSCKQRDLYESRTERRINGSQ